MESGLSSGERDFLLAQYKALRQEILILKERRVKMLTLSLTGIPVLIAMAEKFDLLTLSLLCPVLSIAYGFMFLSEHNGAMRVGHYIRVHLEPALKTCKGMGWEEYLETKAADRGPERYHMYSVASILALYYLAGSVMATLQVTTIYGPLAANGVAGALVTVMVASLFFFMRCFRCSTTERQS